MNCRAWDRGIKKRTVEDGEWRRGPRKKTRRSKKRRRSRKFRGSYK
jgi:hypothetical protein